MHKDSVALLRVTDTKAETIFHAIKDLLIRCDLPLSMCCGQAYDGASNMQGRRKGVATRFKQENPAAIALHCCAHSLNLCLQDAAKNLNCIRDALETVKEISTLIRYSPKQLHLFMTKLNSPESDSGAVTLKPLCATRWTARTPAIHAVITDYTLLLEILEEIHLTTKDEYGTFT